MAVKSTVVGAVVAVLATIVLGVITFGIGMARESVYTVPGMWRGGVEQASDGFYFVVQPHFVGVAILVAVGALIGLTVGLVRNARR